MGVSLECWRGRIGCFILRYSKSQFKMKTLTSSGSLLQLFLLLNLLMHVSGVTLSHQNNIVLKKNDQGNDSFHDAQTSVGSGIQIVHCKVPFISRHLEMCSDVEMNPGPFGEAGGSRTTSHSVEYKLQLDSVDQLQRALKKRSVTMAVLEKHIQEEGYTFSDGNCFFHAIVDQLQRDKDNDTDDHLQLRQSVVNYLHDNRYLADRTDKYSFVSGYETWTDYIQIMKKYGTWADHLVVMATAELLQREIWIFTSSQEGDYPAINCIKIDIGCHPHGEPLVVAHYNEMHYQSLERTGNKDSTDDELQMALQISSGCDVDLKTMKKKLKQAGFKFRGLTPSDGNSFFHAIIDQLDRLEEDREDSANDDRDSDLNNDDTKEDEEETYETLRIRLVEHIIQRKHAYLPLREEYVLKIKEDKAQVDYIVIKAMAHMLDREIWIFTNSLEGEHTCVMKTNKQDIIITKPLLIAHYKQMTFQSLEQSGLNFLELR